MYNISNSNINQFSRQKNTFYFDDGSTLGGFNTLTKQQNVPQAPIAAISGNITQQLSQTQNFDFNLIRINDLNSSYLGISQQYYYFLAYMHW